MSDDEPKIDFDANLTKLWNEVEPLSKDKGIVTQIQWHEIVMSKRIKELEARSEKLASENAELQTKVERLYSRLFMNEV